MALPKILTTAAGVATGAGGMLLRKKHRLRGPFQRPPLRDPTLQRPSLPIGKGAWIRALKVRTQGLRFQPWIQL